MTKRNAVIRTLVASAVLAVIGSAQAGSVTSTARIVANEAFGTAIAQPTVTLGAISLPSLAYAFNTPGGIVVNNGGSVKVVFTLTGGTTDVAGTFAAANVTLSAGLTGFTPTVAVSGTTITITLTNGSGGNLTIGIGGTVTLASTVANAQYRVVGVTQGSNVTATGTALNGFDNSVLEAATPATNVITFADAVTASSVASTATTKISLSTVPTPGTALTAGTTVSFGGVKLTNATGTQVKLDNAATADTDIDMSTATAYTQGGTFTIGKASGSFTPGMTVGIFTDETCTTAIAGTATVTNTPVGAITAATTTVSITYTGLTSAQLTAGVFACGNYSVATGAFNSLTPTVAFTYNKFSTSYSDETVAAFNGYALGTNGAVKDVRSYIPAAAAGYTSFVRIINTGSITASVTGQFVNADGTLGATSGVLAMSLAAGGSVTLTSAQVEAAIGGTAPAASARPRLRLTAPTSGLEAQSFFLTNANGNFSDATGAQ